MPINSKDKGKRFELQVAHLFKDKGYSDARRTAQYCGNTGLAGDVEGVPYLHIECKHQERMQLYEWIEQAKRDSSFNGKLPVVIHKRNNCEVLVTTTFENFIKLYKEYEINQFAIGEDMANDKNTKSIKSLTDT